jgi:hypothetical protein
LYNKSVPGKPQLRPLSVCEFSNGTGEAFVDMLTTWQENELSATAAYDALCLSI